MNNNTKRNLIKSTFPKAYCIRLKGNLTHYIVGLGAPDHQSVAVGTTPMQAWALAYAKLKEAGRVQ